MNMKPSRHVTRSNRIHFEGNPESGRVDVRAKDRVPFSLVRTQDKGWVTLIEDSDQKFRSILPSRVLRLTAQAAYFFAISQLWGTK